MIGIVTVGWVMVLAVGVIILIAAVDRARAKRDRKP